MRICDATGLERHAVAALYHNKVSYVSMKTLATICDYLVEHGGVPRSEVLQRLFGLEVGDFWGMLVRPSHLRICAGIRNIDQPLARRWMMASDAMLQGKLLHKISQTALHATPGGPARPVEDDAAPPAPAASRGQIFEQHLVMSPPYQGSRDDVIDEARQLYESVNEYRDGEQALICLGSPKSNPVAELVYAHAFGLVAFRSADTASPGERRSPIFYVYREDGPQPESCCGGLQLPGSSPSDPLPEPGIYYENEDAQWVHCACDDEQRVSAVIFYVYRRHWGRVEVVIGGYSSQATEQLARVVPTLNTDRLRTIYSGPGLNIGAMIVEIEMERHRGDSRPTPQRHPSVNPIQLEKSVIERRVVK